MTGQLTVNQNDSSTQGKTNGQSLEEVWNQLLKRTCEAQTVSGQLTVHTLTVDHLSTPALTNPNDDLRVADLLNILLVDGDQVITGMLNFTSVEAQRECAGVGVGIEQK
ncbi:hypothetical protein E2C01_079474 [Portunus trituberculatus]|uniref:Uncharacterized protein n=1 Tax=Portunus trituberculatus TaxID=210409 RepID=A0A5B7ISV6_PORTR|nr:hypothetical protein [Portunus trituberculatus]